VTSRTIRWGILGTGRAAHDFARGLRFVPGAEAVAVASRSHERAEAFARRLRIPRAYPCYEDLIADGDVEVVYIATPPHRHMQDSLSCLEAGLAILCEKPFAINAAEAREIVLVAQKARVFCMEAMWMRFMPLIRRAREVARTGQIGDVRLISADFGMATPFDASGRLYSRELGGGALLERGVYGVSLAQWLLGKPEKIWAQARIGSTAVDEQSTAILSYRSGAQAIVTASLRERSSNEALIVGTRGRVRIHEFFFRPERLTVDVFADSPEPVPYDDKSLRGRAITALKENRVLRGARLRAALLVPGLSAVKSQEIIEPISGNGYNYEADEVARCLRADLLESPDMPWAETIAVLETMDAIRAQYAVHYPADVTT
jgi:predicted dehydrogenase